MLLFPWYWKMSRYKDESTYKIIDFKTILNWKKIVYMTSHFLVNTKNSFLFWRKWCSIHDFFSIQNRLKIDDFIGAFVFITRHFLAPQKNVVEWEKLLEKWRFTTHTLTLEKMRSCCFRISSNLARGVSGGLNYSAYSAYSANSAYSAQKIKVE